MFSAFQYANAVACQCQRQESDFILLQFICLYTHKGLSGRIFLNTEFNFINILLLCTNTKVIDNSSSEY